MPLNVAADIGGTFTDLFGYDSDSERIYEAKCLSTPPDFATGVLDGVKKSGVPLNEVQSFVHGSTVAINIAIERTGAKTALVVTRGTRHVYKIGRGNRPDAYNIFFKRPDPLTAPGLTFEIDQRTSGTGETLVPFDENQAREVARKIAESGAESVAVCFLHSYADPTDESRMGELLKEAGVPFISLSHDISKKYGEYERISTTVLNSYIGPRTSSYLRNLDADLRKEGFDGRLFIMQSNGGLMSVETAQKVPVSMMESGPVGGVMAAAYVASDLGYPNSISFDMGGTTAKSSLIQGREPVIAEGYFIGGYDHGHPAMLPVVEIVEVGTGGGSIAWADDIGRLNVGPRSAGADPGPICYRRGGESPTVTDADVVLGRIGSESFLGGEMNLDVDTAAKFIGELGEKFGYNAQSGAAAVINIAVAKMSLAVRGVSVERGFDPRDFAMVAIGGAGPVHAVPIARELNIPVVIVPVLPAHFSALGMLLCDIKHDYVRTFYSRFEEMDVILLRKIVDELIAEGTGVLKDEQVDTDAMSFQIFLDLRYEGQEFCLAVPVTREELHLEVGMEESVRKTFDEMHDRSFGHSAPDEPIEIVNVRLSARGARDHIKMRPETGEGFSTEPTRRMVILDSNTPEECFVYRREVLKAGDEVKGPAVIEEYASTTVLFGGDIATVAATGELVIQVGAAS